MNEPLTPEQQSELIMMELTEQWPCWPLLPIKRWKDGKLEIGVLYEVGLTKTFKFANANLWDIEYLKEEWRWDTVTLEDIVRCGWVGD